MNTIQQTFEFELLDTSDGNGSLLKQLTPTLSSNREEVKNGIPSFLTHYEDSLNNEIKKYNLKEPLPDYYVLVTMARFSDNYYSTRKDKLSILALGNWERNMAPPSIVEFILTLIIREAISTISPSLRGSIHMGTKGCLMDFTPTLNEVRLKVFNGFICSYCQEALTKDGLTTLVPELILVLRKQWLGNIKEPNSPAGITSKLGYNLFTTKGLEPTIYENLLAKIQEEGVKQLLNIIGVVIIAILLLLFRLN